MCFRLVLAARQDNSKQSVANLFHWWVPKEISEILGINNHRNVVSRLDEIKRESILWIPLVDSNNFGQLTKEVGKLIFIRIFALQVSFFYIQQLQIGF